MAAPALTGILGQVNWLAQSEPIPRRSASPGSRDERCCGVIGRCLRITIVGALDPPILCGGRESWRQNDR